MFEEIIAFAQKHSDEDPLKLLLQQKKYPDIDLQLVAQQLEGQRQASTKWPTLALKADYLFPPKINREQSSSEITAQYKASIFSSFGGGNIADLTGGMGIDSYYLSLIAKKTDYFELNECLFPISEHNFTALDCNNISCYNCDSIQYLAEHDDHYDMILIDPARRDTKGSRVVAFEDCTPNIVQHLPLLLSHSKNIMVKASPMIDITQATKQLEHVAEIHIVAVGNECKEILFIIKNTEKDCKDPIINCVNLATKEPNITFTRKQEDQSSPLFATTMQQYLYEPNASLMKGGCFSTLSEQYQIRQLSRNTHLYTDDKLLSTFPGRIFKVLHEVPLNSKKISPYFPDGKAHVITRNYPATASELQKKLKLKEGGSLFVIAATMGTRPMGWICERVD